MDEQDEEIILEMCEGEEAVSISALGRLLEERGPFLLRRIKRTLSSHGLSGNLDDVATEIFQALALDLWQAAKKGALLEVKSLPEYVYGAARRRTLYYLRSEACRRERTPPSETFWEETDRILVQAGVMPAEMAELEEALYDCINELPGLQRKYIRILADNYECPPTPSEIADMHAVSPESVRNRLHDAREKLMECLEKKGYQIPNPLKGAAR